MCNIFKKILLTSILLCLFIGSTSFVKVIHGDEEVYTEGTLFYIVEDESITITGCFGKDETIEIPNQIAGTPVNTIAEGAFTDNEYIKKIILPDTITTIESGAFATNIEVVQKTIENNIEESPEVEEDKEETKEKETTNNGTSTSTSTSSTTVVIQQGVDNTSTNSQNETYTSETTTVEEVDVDLDIEEAVSTTEEEEVINIEDKKKVEFSITPLLIGGVVVIIVVMVILVLKKGKDK